MDRVKADGFVEWTEFAGNGQLYGTPTLEPPDGLDVVLEIEIDGAAQIKERYPDAVLVLIAAPSREVQAAALAPAGRRRASVARRLAVGEEEDRVGRRDGGPRRGQRRPWAGCAGTRRYSGRLPAGIADCSETDRE